MYFAEIGLSSFRRRNVEDATCLVEGEAGRGESVGTGLACCCGVFLRRRCLLVGLGEGATEDASACECQLADDAVGHDAPGEV